MVEFPRDEESKLMLASRSMMGMDLRGTSEINNPVIKNWIELLAHQLEERGDFLKANHFLNFASFSSFPYRIIVHPADIIDIIRYDKGPDEGWQCVEQFYFFLDPNQAMPDDEIDRVRRKLLDMVLRNELSSDNWYQLPRWMGDVKHEYAHNLTDVFRERI